METFIYSGMESGTVTTTRSSLFKPVSNYQEILNEFENCYVADDGKPQGDKLFWLASESDDGIILVVNECIMSHDFMLDADLEGMTNFMKSNGNSDAAIQFMTNHVEELCAANFIEFLAMPGQTITIQITDLEFGNTEYEMTT
jgi:hypothetical protein